MYHKILCPDSKRTNSHTGTYHYVSERKIPITYMLLSTNIIFIMNDILSAYNKGLLIVIVVKYNFF